MWQKSRIVLSQSCVVYEQIRHFTYVTSVVICVLYVNNLQTPYSYLWLGCTLEICLMLILRTLIWIIVNQCGTTSCCFFVQLWLQQYIFQYLFCADIRLRVTKELNPRHQRKGVLFPYIKRGAATNLASGLWDLKVCLVGWKVRLIENGREKIQDRLIFSLVW